MVNIQVKVDGNALAQAFSQKAGEVSSEFSKFSRDLVDIAHRLVQNEAPRKTGRLKGAVQKVTTNNGGYVFVSKAMCQYADWVIDGTGPHRIVPKNKKALRTPYGIFKAVNHPGTKSNPFVDKGASAMEGELNARIARFEQWLGEI